MALATTSIASARNENEGILNNATKVLAALEQMRDQMKNPNFMKFVEETAYGASAYQKFQEVFSLCQNDFANEIKQMHAEMNNFLAKQETLNNRGM